MPPEEIKKASGGKQKAAPKDKASSSDLFVEAPPQTPSEKPTESPAESPAESVMSSVRMSSLDSEADVGATFRTIRESKKMELSEVAAKLCIRLAYLRAIEDGNIEELPGSTYAIGFVRAYAEFLDLDHKEIVEKFRVQTSGMGGKTELNFPEPVPESRVPGGAILLISLLLAAIAYGGWYRLTMQDGGEETVFTEIPGRLATYLWGDDETVQLEDAPTDINSELAGAPYMPPAADTSLASENGNLSFGMTHYSPSVPPQGEHVVVYFDEQLPQGAVEAVDPGEDAALGGDSPEAETRTYGVTVYHPAFVGEDAGDTAETARLPGMSETSQPPGDEETAPKMEWEESSQSPRVFGQEFGDVRIVITANEDSWVQVRDSSGELLLTQILHSGDTYRAPDRYGLTLLTGNAGALEIFVDGSPVPSLGPTGSIRRDVPLDPERLIAGTAATP